MPTWCTPNCPGVSFFARTAHRRSCCLYVPMRRLGGASRGVTIVPQRCALGDLVSSLHEHSSEVHQTEQSEQVHNVVENEHLSLLSLLMCVEDAWNISRGDTPVGYTWRRPCGRQRR